MAVAILDLEVGAERANEPAEAGGLALVVKATSPEVGSVLILPFSCFRFNFARLVEEECE